MFTGCFVYLQILGLAVRTSLLQIALLAVVTIMGMLVCSTLIYFAEFDVEGNRFSDIPTGFWWSIVTMTTLGYRNYVPSSIGGYFIGAAC